MHPRGCLWCTATVQVPNAVNTATKGDFNAMLNGDRMDWTLKVTAADQVTMGHIHYVSARGDGAAWLPGLVLPRVPSLGSSSLLLALHSGHLLCAP